MTFRPTTLAALAGLVLFAAALAGCASPSENTGAGDESTTPCAPGAHLGGESGFPNGTTGAGTGDIATADGGDPSRPTSPGPCPPGDELTADGAGDGDSTGLGEPGGGYSTMP